MIHVVTAWRSPESIVRRIKSAIHIDPLPAVRPRHGIPGKIRKETLRRMPNRITTPVATVIAHRQGDTVIFRDQGELITRFPALKIHR